MLWTSKTSNRADNLSSLGAALLELRANGHGLLHPDLITVLVSAMLLQMGSDATTIGAGIAVNCNRSSVPLVLN